MTRPKAKKKNIQSATVPALLSATEKPAKPEQETASARRETENWLWKLYEKTLKAFFDSLLGKFGA